MSFLSTSSLPLWLKTLCFLVLARHSNCTPLNTPGYIPLVDTVDISHMSGNDAPSSANISATNLGAPVPNCATLPGNAEWFQPSKKFDNGDCPKALELFFNDYTRDHEGIRYEYLASGVTPVHGIPTQRVPLKVAHGTCYIVIAMRKMFVKGELPGETPTTSAGSDISSFTELYQNAQDIYGKCSNPEVNLPGWYPAGDLNSIAVFIWQGASPINARIHRAPHTDPNLISTSGLHLFSGSVGDTA